MRRGVIRITFSFNTWILLANSNLSTKSHFVKIICFSFCFSFCSNFHSSFHSNFHSNFNINLCYNFHIKLYIFYFIKWKNKICFSGIFGFKKIIFYITWGELILRRIFHNFFPFILIIIAVYLLLFFLFLWIIRWERSCPESVIPLYRF